MVREKTKPIHNQQEKPEDPSHLILLNENVNSLDLVIETLIEVCNHEPIQAEQCAWIAHFKGKCAVKEGTFTELKPIQIEMGTRGLTVSIE